MADEILMFDDLPAFDDMPGDQTSDNQTTGAPSSGQLMFDDLPSFDDMPDGAEGEWATAGREAAHAAVPAAAGFVGMGAGAKLGAAGGAMIGGPVGAAIGGVGGGIVGMVASSMAANVAQEAALKNVIGFDDAEQRAMNRAMNPKSAFVGQMAPALAGMSPVGIGGGLARQAAVRGGGAGISAGFEAGQEYLNEGHVDPFKVAASAAAGAVLPATNRAGAALENVGRRMVPGRPNQPANPAAAQAHADVDDPTIEVAASESALAEPPPPADGSTTGNPQSAPARSKRQYGKEQPPAEDQQTVTTGNMDPATIAAIKDTRSPPTPRKRKGPKSDVIEWVELPPDDPRGQTPQPEGPVYSGGTAEEINAAPVQATEQPRPMPDPVVETGMPAAGDPVAMGENDAAPVPAGMPEQIAQAGKRAKAIATSKARGNEKRIQDLKNQMLDAEQAYYDGDPAAQKRITQLERRLAQLGVKPTEEPVTAAVTPAGERPIETLKAEWREADAAMKRFDGGTMRSQPAQAARRRLQDIERELTARGVTGTIEAAPEKPAMPEFKGDTNPAPTEGQAKRGNYLKARAHDFGKPLAQETMAGGTRKGKNLDGTEWEHELPYDYGYFNKTLGADKDKIDWARPLQDDAAHFGDKHFVIDQAKAENGRFDEHKVFTYYKDKDAALDHYMKGFGDGKGPDRMGAITEVDRSGLVKWLARHTKRRATKAYDEAAFESNKGQRELKAAMGSADRAPAPKAEQESYYDGLMKRTADRVGMTKAERANAGIGEKYTPKVVERAKELMRNQGLPEDAIDRFMALDTNTRNAEATKYVNALGSKTGKVKSAEVTRIRPKPPEVPGAPGITARDKADAQRKGDALAKMKAAMDSNPPVDGEDAAALRTRLEKIVADAGDSITVYKPAVKPASFQLVRQAKQMLLRKTWKPEHIEQFNATEKLLRSGEAGAADVRATNRVEADIARSRRSGDDAIASAQAQDAVTRNTVEDDLIDAIDAKRANVPHEEAFAAQDNKKDLVGVKQNAAGRWMMTLNGNIVGDSKPQATREAAQKYAESRNWKDVAYEWKAKFDVPHEEAEAMVEPTPIKTKADLPKKAARKEVDVTDSELAKVDTAKIDANASAAAKRKAEAAALVAQRKTAPKESEGAAGAVKKIKAVDPKEVERLNALLNKASERGQRLEKEVKSGFRDAIERFEDAAGRFQKDDLGSLNPAKIVADAKKLLGLAEEMLARAKPAPKKPAVAGDLRPREAEGGYHVSDRELGYIRDRANGLTLDEIAKRDGVSPERVRQVFTRASERLLARSPKDLVSRFIGDEAGSVDLDKFLNDMGRLFRMEPMSHKKSYIAKTSKIAHSDYTRSLSDSLHTLSQEDKSHRLGLFKAIDDAWNDFAPKTPGILNVWKNRKMRLAAKKDFLAMMEKVYHAHEQDKLNILSPKELAFYDKHVKPLYDEIMEMDKLIRTLDPDKIGPSVVDGKYIHRIVKSSEPEFKLLKDQDDPTLPSYHAITTHADAAKTREFVALERVSDGKRFIISPRAGGGYTLWNKYKAQTVKDADFDFKPGDTYSVTTKNGQQIDYVMRDAFTHEIELNALGKNRKPMEYYKNAMLSMAMAHAQLGSMARHLQELQRIRETPEFKKLTAPAGSPTAREKGWEPPRLQNFKDTAMDPHLRYVFDDYAKTGFDTPEKLRAVSQAITKLLFWTPAAHLANVGAHWYVGRGWDWFTPKGYKSLALDGFKAIKSVITQDELQQELRKHGAGTIYGGVLTRAFTDQVFKRLEEDMTRNPSKWGPIADKLGLSSKKLFNLIYDTSAKVMWAGNDMFLTQRVLELMRKGKSMKDAIVEAERDIPNYRVPTTLITEGPWGRMMQQAATTPEMLVFGRYHYGVFNSFANILKDALGKDSTVGDRWDAIGRIMATAVLGFVTYPLWDKAVRALTQNEDARAHRRGPMAVASHIGDSLSGESDIMKAMRSTTTVSPMVSTAVETLVNRDYRGKQIVEPGDVRRAARGDVKAGARALTQFGEHKLKGLVSPYGTISNAEKKDLSPAGALRDALLDFKNPSPRGAVYSRKVPALTEKEARSRFKHGGSGPMEKLLNKGQGYR